MACRTTDDAVTGQETEKTCNGDCGNCGASASLLSQFDPANMTGAGLPPRSTQASNDATTVGR
jgi:hypothetical protein